MCVNEEIYGLFLLILRKTIISIILIGQEHTEGLIDFVRRNSLPLDIKVDDYHEGPCLLASLGYMVVKSENDSSILVYYFLCVLQK